MIFFFTLMVVSAVGAAACFRERKYGWTIMLTVLASEIFYLLIVQGMLK
jgi:hypothetical protein